MAELGLLDELSDEVRSELDEIERGTPDLERQIRAATVAVEDEEKEAETRNANEPDGAACANGASCARVHRLTEYITGADARPHAVNGAEAELDESGRGPRRHDPVGIVGRAAETIEQRAD